ncbi:innexin inx2-like [Frankliniella occidentalis]|uniref:Innexin n=1 Tax=Frankliniella occidentalis TaxID=133901 RepID=A0A6J1T3I0_FRAOC|nr:innexin inx2-like [Frankliniella occidentalis]
MTMLAVFGALRGVVRTNAPGEVHLSSVWSALHHRLTAILLLFLMLLVSARQYLGEPVQCVQQKDDAGVPESVMNTYCFIATTYTVVRPRPAAAAPAASPWGRTGTVRGALHPGLQGLVQNLGDDPALDDPAPGVADEQGASIRRHAYYQWVPLVLGMQAVLFAAPYMFWTLWEGGLVAGALRGLRLQEVVAADKRLGQVRLLARYFHGTLNSHTVWAVGYWAVEVLNLCNVVLNALALDALLGGRFFSYGMQVLAAAPAAPAAPAHPQLLVPRRLDPYPHWEPAAALHRPADPLDHPEDPADPMEAVFPKLTKCTFFKYGPSGSIQRHDALCVMALNVVNEKVFVLLWVWFAMLAAASLLIVVRTCAAMAAYACTRRSASRNRLTLWLFGRLLGLPPLSVGVSETLAGHLNVGDWLFLLLLAKNMPRVVYRSLANEIAIVLGPNRGPTAPPNKGPAEDGKELDPLVPLVEVTT